MFHEHDVLETILSYEGIFTGYFLDIFAYKGLWLSFKKKAINDKVVLKLISKIAKKKCPKWKKISTKFHEITGYHLYFEKL